MKEFWIISLTLMTIVFSLFLIIRSFSLSPNTKDVIMRPAEDSGILLR